MAFVRSANPKTIFCDACEPNCCCSFWSVLCQYTIFVYRTHARNVVVGGICLTLIRPTISKHILYINDFMHIGHGQVAKQCKQKQKTKKIPGDPVNWQRIKRLFFTTFLMFWWYTLSMFTSTAGLCCYSHNFSHSHVLRSTWSAYSWPDGDFLVFLFVFYFGRQVWRQSAFHSSLQFLFRSCARVVEIDDWAVSHTTIPRIVQYNFV